MTTHLKQRNGFSPLSEVAEFHASRQQFLLNLNDAVLASSIVSKTDLQGRITFVNDQFMAISGYSREELIGANHRVVNSGIHPPSFWVNVWKTISSGQAWRGEVCNRSKSGRRYWVDTFIYPFMNAEGSIVEYFSIRNDITERKAQEEALTRSAEMLRSVFTSSSDLYYLVDTRKELRSANDRGEAIFFQSKTIRDGFKNWIHWNPQLTTFLNYALDGESVDEQLNVTMADGRKRWFQIRCVPALKSGGVIVGASLSLSDIHERKMFELELIGKNERLTEIAWIQSHEIRRPVASILGLLQLMEMDPQLGNHELIIHMKKMAVELDERTREIVRKTGD